MSDHSDSSVAIFSASAAPSTLADFEPALHDDNATESIATRPTMAILITMIPCIFWRLISHFAAAKRWLQVHAGPSNVGVHRPREAPDFAISVERSGETQS